MSIIFNKNLSTIENIDNLRTLNTIIFLTSFLLLLYIGFSSNIGILAHLVYLTFISSVPMYAYLGGSITNDNLAILGGILFIIGLKKILEKKYTNITFFILGIGIFIAYFSKLTAAILIFFALLLYLIYIFKSKIKFKISKVQITILAIFILPVIAYQLYIFIHYHSLLPSFNLTHHEQYLHSVFFIPESSRHYLNHFQWLQNMIHYILEGWFGIHSHHSFVKHSFIDYIGLLILHIMALITLFFKCRNDSKVYCLLGKIGLISVLFLLIVQYVFSYFNHLNTGYMGGLQPRYALPFLFSFAILASIFVNRFSKIFLFDILVILICVQTIYSDFFYFLKYYS